ncbi:MAG: double-strand break repair protein AddB, partial [Pseudomonadota bacterium]
MELFADPGPRVFTIAPGLPFARALADGVVARLAAAGAGPEALADVEIVVSTRRAARAIRSAFIAACGGVALGPRLKTLAELGADEGVALDAPAAIDPTARRLALTRLVRALLVQRPDLGATAAAPGLAADLEALLDAAQASGARLDRLDAVIAEARHAEHWRVSSQFLDLIRTVWPAHLDEIDRIDPAARNRRAVAALETRWADHPPRHPVIVAGSTGSLDTSAWFIELVSRLPQGAVVLPGLDQEMDADCERALREHGAPEHPQAGLIALIDRIGTDRAAVADWAPDRRAHAAPRLRLLSQALRP